ncbi:MAG: hypothetical protein ACLR8P_16755 [Clostridium fessum]
MMSLATRIFHSYKSVAITKIIVNVCGKTTEDYVEVVERLAGQPVDLLGINILLPERQGGRHR